MFLPLTPVVRLLASALLALTFVCVAEAKPVTLKFWVMGREGEVVRQLLPAFERTHPDIRVDVQQVPWSVAHEKLLTAFAGGALPDLCQLGNTWIAEFSAIQALADLTALAGASRIVTVGDYFRGIWDTNVVAARLEGIPWYVDTRLLFYRKDLLEQSGVKSPPRSWSEWQQAFAAIKRIVGPNRYSILLPLNEPEPLLAFALQQNEPLLRDNGQYGAFSQPAFRRALQFYASMFRNGWAPSLGDAQIANVWDEFARGLFAFYISGPWNIEEFKRRLPAQLQSDWMTAPLPGPSGPGVSIAGGASLVIFRSSRHTRAAWQLIEYLSQPDVEVRFHALTGNLPPRRAPWRDPQLANDVYARAFRDQLERVRAVPRIPEWERIAEAMQETAEEVVRGGVSIDDATRALDRRVDAILEKRRWMIAHGKMQ